MNQFYSFFSRSVFTAAVLLTLGTAQAQNPTTVGPGNCDVVSEDFTEGPGRFSSPGLYGDIADHFEFFYNQPRGYWTDLGNTQAGTTTPPPANRELSITSPTYINPSPVGQFNVGFRYIVPNPAADQFNVLLIRITTFDGPSGPFSESAIVARTGFRPFSEFSSPTPYTETENSLLTGSAGNVCVRLTDLDITGGSNVTYRVQIHYRVTSANFVVFDDFSLGAIEAAPLPVTFMGLVANRVNHTVSLRWDVADEINVKAYEVERSDDGRTFKTIGTVTAHGKHLYAYSDANAGGGQLLYRIKSVDVDGKFKLSSIIRVAGISSYSHLMKLYPVPARDQVTIQHKKLDPDARITISTADGRVLRAVIPRNGASHTPVDLNGLQPGIYLVRLQDGNGNTETQKLVKQ